MSTDLQNSASYVDSTNCQIYPWPNQYGSYQYPNYQTVYYNWPTTTNPTIKQFRGEVKSLDDLPTGATWTPNGKHAVDGDAFYVKDIKALVVRHANGWYHFDRK